MREAFIAVLAILCGVLLLAGCGAPGGGAVGPVANDDGQSDGSPGGGPGNGQQEGGDPGNGQQGGGSAGGQEADIAVSIGGPLLGVPAEKSPEPDFDFGRQQVGTTGEARTIALVSDAPVAQRINDVSLQGPFRLQVDDCSGATLMPSQACLLEVVFAPTGLGEARADVHLSITGICASEDAWFRCEPEAISGEFGAPTEREELPNGEVLIGYGAVYLTVGGTGVSSGDAGTLPDFGLPEAETAEADVEG